MNIELYTTATLQPLPPELYRRALSLGYPSRHRRHEQRSKPCSRKASTSAFCCDRDLHNKTASHRFNGKTSGSEHGHRDHRTSWARSVCCRPRGECGRTRRVPASAGSCCAHRCTFGSRRSTRVWRQFSSFVPFQNCWGKNAILSLARSSVRCGRPSAYLRRLGGTYDALGNSLTDRVDLRGVTTATDADSDVNVGCTHTHIVSKRSCCPVPLAMTPVFPA